MYWSKNDFREVLATDKTVFDEYVNSAFKSKLLLYLVNDHIIKIQRYIKRLRYSQYYKMKYEAGNKLSIFPYIINTRYLNRLGNKLGFFISPGAKIGKGLMIYHHGTIIINGNAVIGDYCKLHGNNCIGNGGGDSQNAPNIGNNCDIGFGATIIGGIKIADDATIGAGAVVNKDCYEKQALLVGVPALLKERGR